MPKFLLAMLALCLATAVHAADAPLTAAEPELEKQMLRISGELRCLVCQNETIAASNAELAVDLRKQIRDMLRQGQSQQQIIDYMTARYGDFILYRPPMTGATFLLWFGPTVLMVGGLAVLVLVLRRRSRLGNEHFDPEEPEDIEATARPAEPAK
jgi:cytochrome c-type biogenesis protein CcmH